MGKSIIKELFIVALLMLVIMFTLGILLYDFIPTSKSLPGSIEYMADSTVTATLQEITADSEYQDATDNSEQTDSLLRSYSIGKSDLKNYESKNAFESGKADPFSDYVENPDTNAVTDPNTGTTTNTVAGNTTNSNTGTFFEKPSSK